MYATSVLNEIFDKIYVINLPHRKDKFDLITYKLSKRNLRYEIFYGTNGHDIQLQPRVDLILNQNSSIKSKGAVGLLLTYQRLLEEIIKHQYQQVLILEDDCNFVHNFELGLRDKRHLFDFVKNDVIYLGANQVMWNQNQIKNREHGFYTVSPVFECITFGTYAISMNLSFSQALLERLTGCLTNLTDLHSIDIFIQQLLYESNYKAIVLFPFLIMPDVTDSDILNHRNQSDFCLGRKYVLEDYDYISIDAINSVRQFLTKQNVSLRQLCWNHKTVDIELFKSISDNSTFIRHMESILKYAQKNTDSVYRLIEGSDHKFVFVVPSYNNKDNYEINLDSIMKQSYPPYLFRIVYIDDRSTDGTYELVQKKIVDNSWQHKFKLIKQQAKGYQGLGRYLGYHMASDDEIVVFLDGDDWLAIPLVLQILNQEYQKKNLLASYGSFYIYHNDKLSKEMTEYGSLQGTREFPSGVVSANSYNDYDWISGHLRTCMGKLVKSIRIKDLISLDGTFYKISTDRAEMIPVLEMSATRHANLRTGLYVYNKVNSVKYYSSYYNAAVAYGQTVNRRNVVSHLKAKNRYNAQDLNRTLSVYQITEMKNLAEVVDMTNTIDRLYGAYQLISGQNDYLQLIDLTFQTGAFIISNVYLNPAVYNYITESSDTIAFRIGSNPSILIKELLNSPGIYHLPTLIAYLETNSDLSDEIVICRYKQPISDVNAVSNVVEIKV